MRRMHCTVPEVAACVSMLAVKMITSPATMSQQEVGLAFNGLQGMQMSTPEVRILLGALVTKLQQSQGHFTGATIGSVMMGLRNIAVGGPNPPAVVVDLINELVVKISESTDILDARSVSSAVGGLR